MYKNFLVFFLVLFGSILYSKETINLDFYKETEHFQAYCLKNDITATESVLQDLENFYKKCTQDFNFLPPSSEKIRLNLYPDIQTFHSTLHENNLSDWKVGRYSSKDNCIYIVNPKNPGSIHTEETTMKTAKYALSCFFIAKKHPSSFLWPSLGLALYEAQPYSNAQLRQYLTNNNGQISLPSFSQIDDQLTKGEFDSRSYPMAAYAFMNYLVSNWGWNKALEVLENYPNFESTLQISQEDFQNMCIQDHQKKLFKN